MNLRVNRKPKKEIVKKQETITINITKDDIDYILCRFNENMTNSNQPTFEDIWMMSKFLKLRYIFEEAPLIPVRKAGF